MESGSDSDEELFPIVNDRGYLNISVFAYDDPLLVTGILRAVVEDDLNKVKEMVRSGKSVNINDNNGNTPLHVAVIKNNLEILEYLLSCDDIIINTRNFAGATPLYQAVRLGKLASVKMLVQAGANINIPDYQEITPLHISVRHPEIAHFLVKQGAHLNVADFNGDTPLHDAISELCFDTIYMFLYYNVDVNFPGGENCTPFMKAVLIRNTEIQEILLEYVDDFNTQCVDERTVLSLALSLGSPFVGEIIERGANVNKIGDNAFNLCLSIPNPTNFKFVWPKLYYNHFTNNINVTALFEYLENDILEKYIQIIIESGNIIPIVESLSVNKNFNRFINEFALKKLKLEQLTVFTCCLLQHGYRLNNADIFQIFVIYGHCELINILLYMDNNLNHLHWEDYMILPRLIFDLDFSLSLVNSTDFICKCYIDALKQLFEYVVDPPLITKMSIYAAINKEGKWVTDLLKCLPQLPSLVELARSATREYIIKSYDITSTCHYYTIINHMNIPRIYKDILFFKRKLYRIQR